jgi:uncharacterized protein YxeA
MKRIIDVVLALIVLIIISGMILRLTNDNMVERANEVSEDRINNNIIWRDSLWV